MTDASRKAREVVIDSELRLGSAPGDVIIDGLPAGSYDVQVELKTLGKPRLLAEQRVDVFVGQTTIQTLALKPVPADVFDQGEREDWPAAPTAPGESAFWVQIAGVLPGAPDLGFRKARGIAQWNEDGTISFEVSTIGLPPGFYAARLSPSTYGCLFNVSSTSGESARLQVPPQLAKALSRNNRSISASNRRRWQGAPTQATCMVPEEAQRSQRRRGPAQWICYSVTEPNWKGRTARRPLQASVLTLTKGINGGIVGPSRHRVVTFSYDWNRSSYRAVVFRQRHADDRDDVPLYRACDLSEDEFRRILDGVRDLGLGALPVEYPVDSWDIYERDVEVKFLHGDVNWRNGAPGGCERGFSFVQPTPDLHNKFDAVMAFIERSLDLLDLQPASAQAGSVVIIDEPWVSAAFQRTVERLRQGPMGDCIDYNRVSTPTVFDGSVPEEFHLALLDPRHPTNLHPSMWPCYVRVQIDMDNPEIIVMANEHARWPTGADRARCAAFVAANPDCTVSQRKLIELGWIAIGMPQAMIQAAWDEPKGPLESEVSITAKQWNSRAHGVSMRFVDGKLAKVIDLYGTLATSKE